MMESKKHIGTVCSVDTNTVSAILHNSTKHDTGTDGMALRVGRLGSFVMMSEGEFATIGSITSVRRLEPQSGEDEKQSPRTFKQVIDIQLIGTVRDGKFERSVSNYPIVGSEVFAADAADL